MGRFLSHIAVTAVGGFVMLVASSAPAATFLYEQFNYSTGDLGAQNASWVDATAPGFGVASPGLDHPSLASETGNKAAGKNVRSRIALGATIGDENETVYLSFLFQADSNSNAPFGGFSFDTIELYDGNTREYAIGLLRGDGNTASAQFEHRAYDLASSATPDLGAFNTNTNLLLAKFTYTNGGNDLTIDAWLNPDQNTDLNAASNRITITGTAFQFDGLAMAAFANGTANDGVRYDEIRLANAAPVFVPSPTALPAGLAMFGSIAMRRRRAR